MTGADVGSALHRLVASGGLDLPAPGSGGTARRHRALFDLARREAVSVARCAEAHVDALAILAEAGRPPVEDACYGVWASAGDLRVSGDGITVDGVKPFCSGVGVVDRALVTAHRGDHAVLLDLDVRPGATLRFDVSGWSTDALAAARTGSATFSGHPIGPCDGVGPPGWYLSRPGFWHGACGPAACWAGGTAGLVDAAEELVDDDPHRRAHLGALRAAVWTMSAVLDHAGHEIDAQPDDAGAARYRALAVRHTIERSCTEVLDRFGRAFGPRPLASDAVVTQRFADVHLYLRQDHAERDLQVLGELPTGPAAAPPGQG